MRAFEPWHLIVLVALVALLFGSKRLPDVARGLGQSMRIFKAEVKEMRKEDVSRPSGTGSTSASSTSGPIEGRVVETDPTRRESSPSERPERRNEA